MKSGNRLVGLIGVALVVLFAGCKTRPPVVETPRPRHIDLGMLFQSGDTALQEGAGDRVLSRLRQEQVSKAAPVRVEVFGDDYPPHPHARPDSMLRLSELRADALRKFLVGAGYTVTSARGRGADVVDGRKPDRRAEVIVDSAPAPAGEPQ